MLMPSGVPTALEKLVFWHVLGTGLYVKGVQACDVFDK